MKILKILLFLIVMGSCTSEHEKIGNIQKLLKSDSPDSLIRAFHLIGRYNRTEYVPDIFHDIDDPRITHDLHFKGMSVYESKVRALREISGLEPPATITYKPDSAIIDFYLKWASKMRYSVDK